MDKDSTAIQKKITTEVEQFKSAQKGMDSISYDHLPSVYIMVNIVLKWKSRLPCTLNSLLKKHPLSITISV